MWVQIPPPPPTDNLPPVQFLCSSAPRSLCLKDGASSHPFQEKFPSATSMQPMKLTNCSYPSTEPPGEVVGKGPRQKISMWLLPAPGGHRLSLSPVKDSRRKRLRQIPGGGGRQGFRGHWEGQGFRQAGEGEGMGSFQAEGAAWAMTQHHRASSNGQDDQNNSARSGEWQVAGEKRGGGGGGGEGKGKKE